MAYAQVTGTTPTLVSTSYTIKEAGYAYVYVSNEHAYVTDVNFDDVKMTYTASSVIQSSEYYPFGMQTPNSWTRETNTNNFLYNQGSELNATTALYDLPYRNYDAALGRFFQVDPMATSYAGLTSYNYAGNNPVVMNDPYGAEMQNGANPGQTATDRLIYRNFISNQSGPDSGYGDWAASQGYGGIMDWTQMMMDLGGGMSPLDRASQDAQAVRNGQMSVGEYAARNGEHLDFWVVYDHTGESMLYLDRSFWSDFGETGGIDTQFAAYKNGEGEEYQRTNGNGLGDGNWSTTMAAVAMSGVLVADDATGVGVVDDVVIPFLIAGAVAADLYKRQPNGAQYTLRAKISGLYPVYSWGGAVPTGTKYLNAGDVWKIGETIQYDPTTREQWRYSQTYLNSMNVFFAPEYEGPKAEIIFVQQMKLAQYLYSNGYLPAGNKGLK